MKPAKNGAKGIEPKPIIEDGVSAKSRSEKKESVFLNRFFAKAHREKVTVESHANIDIDFRFLKYQKYIQKIRFVTVV